MSASASEARRAQGVELADTYGSGPYAERHEGSNPSLGKKYGKKNKTYLDISIIFWCFFCRTFMDSGNCNAWILVERSTRGNTRFYSLQISN